MRALGSAVVALVLVSLLPSPAAGGHPACEAPERAATAVGPFYVVDTLRFVYEETNGVPGLQLGAYGCGGHADLLPGDTCYFDREQTSSTRCPGQVTSRWL